MSAIETLRDALFGNPPSPVMEPSREGVLAAVTELQQCFSVALGNIGLTGLASVSVEEAADLTLSHPAATVAIVYADIEANNDLWAKSGGPGSGSWTNTNIIHDMVESVIGAYAADVITLAASLVSNARQDTAIGIDSLQSLTLASGGNAAFGHTAGRDLTDGQNNTFVGANVGRLLETVVHNALVGAGAASSLIGGDDNTALGSGAIGISAGAPNKTTAVGRAAAANITGDENTAIGFFALLNAIVAAGHTAIGAYAAGAVEGGSNSTFVGAGAGSDSGVQPANPVNAIAIGAGSYAASNEMRIGNAANTVLHMFGGEFARVALARYYYALGNDAGNAASISNGFVGLGEQAGALCLSGDLITAIGHCAMAEASAAGNAVAVGAFALKKATSGVIDTVGVGNNVLENCTATVGTTAVGHWSMRSMLTGVGNTGVGDSTLYKCETGIENVAMGYTTSHENVSGDGNTEVGYAAGRTKTAGDYNVTLGHKAGFGVLSGDNNVVVGAGAYDVAGTGSNNTFVGFQAGKNGSQKLDATNSTAVGNGAFTTADNQITLGNSSVAALRCAVTTITAISDERDKAEIEPLPLGLDFIRSVGVFKWVWAARDDSARNGSTDFGVVAQQLDQAAVAADADWAGFVDKDDPEQLYATPGKLLYPLLNAVKELAATVDAQAATIAAMEARLSALEAG